MNKIMGIPRSKIKKFMNVNLFQNAYAGFITTWKTDNTSTGSSNANQVTLPLIATGIYDFWVDWGDGAGNRITAYNVGNTHTYSAIGTYTVTIKGVITGWKFNNTGDRLKILGVNNWGSLVINNDSAFYGCANMNGSATDAPVMIGSMSSMFQSCSAFNQSVSNFDTSKVTDMSYMFYGCAAFKQSLATFVLNANVDMTSMLTSSNINDTGTTTNYDNTLTAWAAQPPPANRSFDGGSAKYSAGAGKTARDILTGTYTWTISDGGQA